MDGSTWVVEGDVHTPGPVHRKYAVRCAWSTDGTMFATASYDKTVQVWQRMSASDAYTPCTTLQFVGNPEAIEFHAVTGQEHEQLLVGVRDDCHLHMYDVASWQVDKINLNLLKDAFVSFTVMDVRVDPSNTFVALATDKDRVMIYSLATHSQV
jgi:WD40 repeat protein